MECMENIILKNQSEKCQNIVKEKLLVVKMACIEKVKIMPLMEKNFICMTKIGN